jgi:hypothetical protein
MISAVGCEWRWNSLYELLLSWYAGEECCAGGWQWIRMRLHRVIYMPPSQGRCSRHSEHRHVPRVGESPEHRVFRRRRKFSAGIKRKFDLVSVPYCTA